MVLSSNEEHLNNDVESKNYLIDELIDNTVNNLKSLVSDINNDKKAKLFLEWLNQFFKYVCWETTFEPQKLRRYKRGEIVLANFGFNVGAEIGGLRFAIVIENQNHLSDGNVVVAPLTTFGRDEKLEETPHGCIYVGEIEGLKSKNNYIKVIQLRPISKLRIYSPKKISEKAFRVSPEVLDKVDEMIRKLFTKNKS